MGSMTTVLFNKINEKKESPYPDQSRVIPGESKLLTLTSKDRSGFEICNNHNTY